MKIYDNSVEGNGTTSPSPTEPDRVHVGIAECAVTENGDILTTNGLGSCVGVALQDRKEGIQGLVHVMLPSKSNGDNGNPTKYADTGIDHLVAEMESKGAEKRRIRAKIAGGSSMLDLAMTDDGVGRRNIEAVKTALDAHEIVLIDESVGGDQGRSIEFEPSGDLLVKTAHAGEERL